MVPPELGATDAEKSVIRTKSGFWKRRSGLEKILLVALGVCGTAIAVSGSYYAITIHNDSNNNEEKPPSPWKQEDVCLTAECAIAAGNILTTMDQTADPCQNFFQYACGGWIANNVIPDAKSRWGKFYELRDKVDQAVRQIIEAPKNDADAKSVGYLKDHYAACSDIDTINSIGYAPFLTIVGPDNFLGGWPLVQTAWDEGKFNVENATGIIRNLFNEAFVISTFVYLDEIDVTHNVIYIDQPGLALPRDMYIEPSYIEFVKTYKNYMMDTAKVMTRELGTNVAEEDLEASIEALYNFEVELAKISTPEDQRRNATELYNPFTLRQLKDSYKIDWDTFFGSVFWETGIFLGDEERIIVREPEYFEALTTLLSNTPKKVIADYIYWRALMTLAEEGPRELVEIAYKFVGAFQGTIEPPPRWSRCVSRSSSEYVGYGMAAGHKYILQYFDDESKDTVGNLVKNLLSAFKELVGESVWMDEETKVKAKDKADSIVTMLGYPDWLPNPSELDKYYEGINAPKVDNHFQNILDVMEWVSRNELKTLRVTPERNTWLTQPAIVNAFYSPNHNSITFPAGILQPSFFGGGYPRYLNYGAIGVVIGHEITHGFDDQGRQYDGNGNALPWWSPETIDAFTKQAQCFIDQYNNYTIPELIDLIGDDAHVNGKNTQGENIADNGGVREAFRAYKMSVAELGPEPRLPGLLDFSPEQMFFVSYAQVWCEKITTQGLLNQILTDPHSPGKFRVFGPLSNSEDFVREFNCPIGPMNRENKCLLW